MSNNIPRGLSRPLNGNTSSTPPAARPANTGTGAHVPSQSQHGGQGHAAQTAQAQSRGSATQLIDSLIVIAAAEVGVIESGNNRGKRVDEYQSATWLDYKGFPWCAAFVCWVLARWITRHGLSIKAPRTPLAFGFEKWAWQEGLSVLSPAETGIQRGDIVIFKFSHIGFAASDEVNGRFNTIEGNTNQAGSREGDGVYKKNRPKTSVRSIIRLV